MPLITVAIPAYGARAGMLQDAIESTLTHASTEDLEVLVVDDATPDDSVREVANRLGVRYVRRDSNGGVAATQNTAVEVAAGRYICFLHSDDRLPPSRPWSTLRGGITVGDLSINGEHVQTEHPSNPRSYLSHRLGVHITAYTFDRSILVEEPFDPNLRCWEDWDLLYRLSAREFPTRRVSATVAEIRGQPGERLSASAEMAVGLAYLYEKYSETISQQRRLQALWEYKIGRRYALSGRRSEGRRWLARSAIHDPLHPRRLWVSVRLQIGMRA